MAEISDIESSIQTQINIINAFLYAPKHLSENVHYRDGRRLLRFKNPNLKSVIAPIIPYNDPQFCCLLNLINEIPSTYQCPYYGVRPLGPRGAVGIPYVVAIGTKIMIAKLTKVDDLYSKYLSEPPTSLSGYPSDRYAVRNCLTDIRVNNIRYIASDEFTNETLIAYILNHLESQQKIPPLYVRHYQGAICTDPVSGEKYGLNLMENCDLGPLDKLPAHPNFSSHVYTYNVNDEGMTKVLQLVEPETILQILTQITVGLHTLQTYINFTSGDLKAGNIFVKSDSIDTTYMSIPLKSSFTCKIADYGKSSCMLYRSDDRGIRFYNDSTSANFYLKFHPFESDIIVDNGEYFYSIGSLLNLQLYTRTRHMGVPFYQSFDYYTILVSMLTNSAFYYPFFATDNLRKIFWDPIWKDSEDGLMMMNKIKTYVEKGTGSSINDALDMLKGVKLRCSAVHAVIKQLQIHYNS
jgi:hypothetical protein